MTTNPYSAPAAPVADPVTAAQGNFVPGGRRVGAGRGWSWIAEGWALFRAQPWTWVLIWIALVVLLVVLNMIPILGPVANSILWPVFSAGLVLGCQSLAQGGRLEFGHLFAGFRERLGTLAGIGAVTLGISMAIMLVVGVGIFGLQGLPGPRAGQPQAAMAGALAGLIVLALMVPLFMAMWFAPALVVLHERGVLDAMKESFQGCLRNVVPFLVYGLVGLVLAALASIPLFLGWLVLGPVLVASIYAGYRDIYFRP